MWAGWGLGRWRKGWLCIDDSSIHMSTPLERNNYYHFKRTMMTTHPGLLSVSILTPRWQELWWGPLSILGTYQRTCSPCGPKIKKLKQAGGRVSSKSVLAPNHMLLPWSALSEPTQMTMNTIGCSSLRLLLNSLSFAFSSLFLTFGVQPFTYTKINHFIGHETSPVRWD